MMPTTDLCWCIISSTVVSLIRDDIVDKLLHIETSMNCFQNHLSALYFSVWTFITLCLMTLHSRYVLVNRTTKILYITTISIGTTVFSNNGLPVKRVQNAFLTTTRGWYTNVYHHFLCCSQNWHITVCNITMYLLCIVKGVFPPESAPTAVSFTPTVVWSSNDMLKPHSTQTPPHQHVCWGTWDFHDR